MEITFSKTQNGHYTYSDNLTGNGQQSADYGVFIDGKLTYVIYNPVQSSRSRFPEWQIRNPDYTMTRIPSKRTLREAKERVIRYINR